MEKNRFQLAIVVCFFLVLASACQFRATPEIIPPTSIPTRVPTPDVEGTYLIFKTIAHDDESGGNLKGFYGKGPWMEILTQNSDIDSAEYPGSQQARSEIKQVDFAEHIVIAISQGAKGSLGYAVDILAVTQMENRILVYASFTKPNSEMEVALTESMPYQVIKIPKDGLNGNFIFELIVDNKVIQRVEVTLP